MLKAKRRPEPNMSLLYLSLQQSFVYAKKMLSRIELSNINISFVWWES